MTRASFARVLALISLVPPGMLALEGKSPAQEDLGFEELEEPVVRLPFVLEGMVLGLDGAPAAGAVVVSSAGGKAVTDADGVYRLEIQAPIDAESVQVTAVGAAIGSLGSPAASASVGLPAAPGSARVGPLALSASAACQPSWLPTFGEYSSAMVVPLCMAVFDDGHGPALYAGGYDFSGNGRIAKWTGSGWSALGGGLAGYWSTPNEASNRVLAMAVFDDGNGAALYAAGNFRTSNGVPLNGVARWNGTSWAPLSTGMNGTVFSLLVFDDGSGRALYAGGEFTTAGGVAAKVARWNGSSWTGLAPLPGTVHAMTVFDDGSGPALHVSRSLPGSPYTTARVTKWNGSTWVAVGGAMVRQHGHANIRALAVWNDGSGPALYAGGWFETAGGVAANDIAKWTGTSWAPLKRGVGGLVSALTTFDDGSGPALYVGGYLNGAGLVSTRGVARWDGNSWTAVELPTAGPVSLAVFDDGGGPALHAGGLSFHTDMVPPTNGPETAWRWSGASWSPLLNPGIQNTISTLTVFDDGSGPGLCAGGSFETADAVVTRGVAQWTGSSWSSFGVGLSGVGRARVLTVFDDGTGPGLHAGGYFTHDAASHGAVRWDGSAWVPLGSPGARNNMDVFDMVEFDDGTGPALYVSGMIGSGDSRRGAVRRWNGTSWLDLGFSIRPSGLNTGEYRGGGLCVTSLAVYDDGSGPALYVGGYFINGGLDRTNRIARWTRSGWSRVGSGMERSVLDLLVFDDGSGPELYATGPFTTAGGVPVNHIARWNGTRWASVGTLLNGRIHTMAGFDDGRGPALYAGGNFTTAGGVAANRIARWDGSSWSPLGSGMSGIVKTLAVFDDGSGPSLFAGGPFDALDSGDSFLAQWGCDTTPPTITCPPQVLVLDGPGQSGEVVTFEVEANDVHDRSPTVVCVPPSGSLFPLGTTLVNCTATDTWGNQSVCSFPVVVLPKHQRPARAAR